MAIANMASAEKARGKMGNKKCCFTCKHFIETNLCSNPECDKESFESCADTEYVIKFDKMCCEEWEDKDGTK